jgi:hypothetical protein
MNIIYTQQRIRIILWVFIEGERGLVKMKNPALMKIAFWVSMAIAILISGYIFKDLADISQWIMQSDRSTTMWVWYNRNILATIALLALAVAIVIKFMHRTVTGNKVMTLLIILFAFQFYSGFINPHIMMRERNDDGHFVSVEEARKYYQPDESVIVIEINGEVRGHSDAQLLRPHVAGKGTLGGEKVVMTYCGLTNLGMAVTPEIDGQALDLRPMTQLENNLVMSDRISGEPVQQIWRQTEAGKNAGDDSSMKEWPTFRMPFKKFAEAYPDAELFVNDYLVEDLKPSFFENPFLAVYDPLMEMIFHHGISSQREHEEPTFPTIKHYDGRLPNKVLVWGFNVGEDYVAYTEEFVRENGNLVNTTVGGQNVVIAYDEKMQSLGIYYNTSGAPVTEIDFYGNTQAGKMERVETVKAGAYWVIWANFFPETDVNRS